MYLLGRDFLNFENSFSPQFFAVTRNNNNRGESKYRGPKGAGGGEAKGGTKKRVREEKRRIKRFRYVGYLHARYSAIARDGRRRCRDVSIFMRR